jgi:GNAT superfamily N-acetyltransferase
MPQLTVQPVTSRRDLRAFVRFPWRVYRGDPNWVPPLIAEQLRTLDPAHNPFFQRADVALFLARRGREVVGRVAAFLDRGAVERPDEPVGGFGFFEVVEEYPVAARLLDAAAAWLRERDARMMRGPMNFNSADHSGVLIGGADCPPAMLESHTPPYYADFLERYGMEKHQDLYAYRASRHQIGENLENLPPELVRVAEAAERLSGATVRQVRLEEWDREVALIHRLFNATMSHLPHRVLIHLNGRLFPFNWLRLRRLIRRVDVATFKMLGVLPSYRKRGIDALLYMEVLRGFIAGGYSWLDGSVTSEYNLMVNLVAQRLGAERYKHFRMYQLTL